MKIIALVLTTLLLAGCVVAPAPMAPGYYGGSYHPYGPSYGPDYHHYHEYGY